MQFIYSLAYQIPEMYFLLYDADMRPISADTIYKTYLEPLNPQLKPKMQHGIFLTVNPITQENMFALHSCQLDLEGKMLLCFYLSLFQLHP
jgi:hypothetical protein